MVVLRMYACDSNEKASGANTLHASQHFHARSLSFVAVSTLFSEQTSQGRIRERIAEVRYCAFGMLILRSCQNARLGY